MKLFTTIPMKFARPLNGKDEGPSYLTRCIKSWQQNGFEVRSICRPHEVEAAATLAPSITISISDIDDALYPGRFGASLGALFAAAPKNEPFGIINADIYTVHSPSISERIQDAAASGLVLAGRTEFNSCLGNYSFRKVDFIAFDPKLLAKTFNHPLLHRLQLGIPWWSWALSIAASYVGPIHYVSRPFLLHMEHSNRWGSDAMERSRACAMDALEQIAGRTNALCARRFLDQYHAASGPVEKHEACKKWLFAEDGADRRPLLFRPKRDPLFQSLATFSYRARLFLDRWIEEF
jgi:hypothetical protein